MGEVFLVGKHLAGVGAAEFLKGGGDLWGPHQSCSPHFSQSCKGVTEGGFPGSPEKNAAEVCLSLSAQQPVALTQWVSGHGLH